LPFDIGNPYLKMSKGHGENIGRVPGGLVLVVGIIIVKVVQY
jgi:hypothetical protein